MILPSPAGLKYHSGWLSGFFDADGSVYISTKATSIHISATNNEKSLLDPLVSLYGGGISVTNTTGRSFKWVLSKKSDIFALLDNYFVHCPSHSAKKNRFKLISTYFELRSKKFHLAPETSANGKIWKSF